MSEYDLMCDVCHKALDPQDAAVSWTAAAGVESEFTLAHLGCVPSGASEHQPVKQLLWPNEYLRFLTDRFGSRIGDPDALRAIAWALAPFVLRHDNPAEMDGMRAASFGAVPGIKPWAKPGEVVAPPKAPPKETEGGK
ncbi:MAG TPA: hypothetical protein VIN34_07980 [Candidatus Limnocylindria bacterium]|jgi:hypothetical protein